MENKRMYRVSDSSRVEDGLLDGLKKLFFGGGKEKTAYSKGDRIKFERENGQRASGIILGALVDLNDKSICYAVQSSATLDPVVVDEDSIIGKNNKGDKKSRGGDRDRDERTDRSSRGGRSRWVDDSAKIMDMKKIGIDLLYNSFVEITDIMVARHIPFAEGNVVNMRHFVNDIQEYCEENNYDFDIVDDTYKLNEFKLSFFKQGVEDGWIKISVILEANKPLANSIADLIG